MFRTRKPKRPGLSDNTVGVPRGPLFGCMKGTLTIAPGVDLTEPACPEWGADADKKYGPDSELGKLMAQVAEREDQRRGK
jgi:hypothetical protein